jgi:hypothetical protein
MIYNSWSGRLPVPWDSLSCLLVPSDTLRAVPENLARCKVCHFKRLVEIITGDKSLSPYRSGPQLVSFFNDFGTNHSYGQGFPSRWMFAEDCIRQFNDTPTLKKVILSAVDPQDFMGATVFDMQGQQNKPANLQDALTYLNEFLAYDGYEIVPHGKAHDIVDKTRGDIVVDVKLEPSHLSHAFIMEQIAVQGALGTSGQRNRDRGPHTCTGYAEFGIVTLCRVPDYAAWCRRAKRRSC